MPVQTIPLTQGFVAAVDSEDYERAMGHKWCAFKAGGGKVYAQTNAKIGGKWTRMYLHRFLTDAPPGVQVDHRDGNGLNCTRGNMRFATHAGNMRNMKPHRNGSSKFKGVSWHKQGKAWLAQITFERKNRYIGLFQNEEDAAKAYDRVAKELFGDFAWLNYPAALRVEVARERERRQAGVAAGWGGCGRGGVREAVGAG